MAHSQLRSGNEASLKQSMNIKEWLSSYYMTSKKKWIYGVFVLTQSGVEFIPNELTDASARVFLKFSAFIDVKKSTSSFIFPTLTIHTKSNGHLFGSFADRESVFHSVLHFRKFCLIPEDEKRIKGSQHNGSRTKLAQDLLSLAADSENTMAQAASTLHRQGEQIDASMATMDDLHNDLDVADRVVTGLETWLGRWSSSTGVPIIDPFVVKQTDLPDISNFEVLYSKAVGNSFSSFMPGSLWISRKDGVTILSEKQQIVQHYGAGKTPLSRIIVINPWEIQLAHFRIGEPDLCYHILSSNAVQAVKQLERNSRGKVEYMPPPQVQSASSTDTGSNRSDQNDLCQLDSASRGARGGVSTHDFQFDSASRGARGGVSTHGFGELMKKKETVSDEDAEQLSHMLSNLKSMAVAVQHEQDHQMGNINSLLTSVDHANIRVNETDQRVQKLLRK